MPPKNHNELLNGMGDGEILALDIGDKRVGVARAHTIAKMPEPLDEIINDTNFMDNLHGLLNKYKPLLLVIGLPHNLSGEETAQTTKIRTFSENIRNTTGLGIVFIDESLTSVDADKFLRDNKNKKYSQDSVAACYILTEFFNQC